MRDTIEDRPEPATVLHKRLEKMPDGRAIIYYTFSAKASGGNDAISSNVRSTSDSCIKSEATDDK